MPTSFKDDVLMIANHPYFVGETYVVQVKGVIKISLFYRGLYAIVDSRVKSRGGDVYEIPVKLDYAVIQMLEKILSKPP